MSLVHFHYDPFTEFERLFDDAFSARFRPSDVSRAVESGSRVGTFRPKYVRDREHNCIAKF